MKANVQEWENWYERVTLRIKEVVEGDNLAIGYIPVGRGEVNGGKSVLVHEESSSWHWSPAGRFYHAQAFLNVFQCVKQWREGQE